MVDLQSDVVVHDEATNDTTQLGVGSSGANSKAMIVHPPLYNLAICAQIPTGDQPAPTRALHLAFG